MLRKNQFAELNIRHRGNSERTLATVRRAVRMGYESVAINVDIGKFGKESDIIWSDEEDEVVSKKRKRKKQKKLHDRRSGDGNERTSESEIVPDPFLVDESKLDLSAFAVNGKRFRQFSRLTVSIDADSIHHLQHNKKVKLYDIIAVRVPDEQILMTLQRKGDFVDLVSLDATAMEKGRLSWLFKQKIVQSCIAAGLTFELCYGNALISSEHRRKFFTNARRLLEITRMGRAGVVLSSGAEDMLQLRGPFDVANLCSLFGLTPKCGRRFVSSNALSVLLRSQTRRHTVKGAIHVVNLAVASQVASTSNLPNKNITEQLATIEEFATEMSAAQMEVKCPAEERENERVEKDEKRPKRKKRKVEEEVDREHGAGREPPTNLENLMELFT
ncbi:hypothetical protein niasHT_015703 [Heterodera trifolii]|uniref:Uncharacterized protein n=1 Tax=Heterodera trifolii TaxID=157864 RepID=A0ABD2L4E7_9BILA